MWCVGLFQAVSAIGEWVWGFTHSLSLPASASVLLVRLWLGAVVFEYGGGWVRLVGVSCGVGV